LRETRASLPLP